MGSFKTFAAVCSSDGFAGRNDHSGFETKWPL